MLLLIGQTAMGLGLLAVSWIIASAVLDLAMDWRYGDPNEIHHKNADGCYDWKGRKLNIKRRPAWLESINCFMGFTVLAAFAWPISLLPIEQRGDGNLAS